MMRTRSSVATEVDPNSDSPSGTTELQPSAPMETRNEINPALPMELDPAIDADPMSQTTQPADESLVVLPAPPVAPLDVEGTTLENGDSLMESDAPVDTVANPAEKTATDSASEETVVVSAPPVAPLDVEGTTLQNVDSSMESDAPVDTVANPAEKIETYSASGVNSVDEEANPVVQDVSMDECGDHPTVGPEEEVILVMPKMDEGSDDGEVLTPPQSPQAHLLDLAESEGPAATEPPQLVSSEDPEADDQGVQPSPPHYVPDPSPTLSIPGGKEFITPPDVDSSLYNVPLPMAKLVKTTNKSRPMRPGRKQRYERLIALGHSHEDAVNLSFIPQGNKKANRGPNPPSRPRSMGQNFRTQSKAKLGSQVRNQTVSAGAGPASVHWRAECGPTSKSVASANPNPTAKPGGGLVKLGIVPVGYPRCSMTNEQQTEIEDKLARLMLDYDEPAPLRFRGTDFRTGNLLVSCADKTTADWVKRIGNSLSLPALNVKVVDERDILSAPAVVGAFPNSLDYTTEDILKLISKQNRCFNCENWIVLGRKETGVKFVELTFAMDADSFKTLKHLNFEIEYRLGVVKLQPKEDEGKKTVDGHNQATASSQNDQGSPRIAARVERFGLVTVTKRKSYQDRMSAAAPSSTNVAQASQGSSAVSKSTLSPKVQGPGSAVNSKSRPRPQVQSRGSTSLSKSSSSNTQSRSSAVISKTTSNSKDQSRRSTASSGANDRARNGQGSSSVSKPAINSKGSAAVSKSSSSSYDKGRRSDAGPSKGSSDLDRDGQRSAVLSPRSDRGGRREDQKSTASSTTRAADRSQEWRRSSAGSASRTNNRDGQQSDPRRSSDAVHNHRSTERVDQRSPAGSQTRAADRSQDAQRSDTRRSSDAVQNSRFNERIDQRSSRSIDRSQDGHRSDAGSTRSDRGRDAGPSPRSTAISGQEQKACDNPVKLSLNQLRKMKKARRIAQARAVLQSPQSPDPEPRLYGEHCRAPESRGWADLDQDPFEPIQKKRHLDLDHPEFNRPSGQDLYDPFEADTAANREVVSYSDSYVDPCNLGGFNTGLYQTGHVNSPSSGLSLDPIHQQLLHMAGLKPQDGSNVRPSASSNERKRGPSRRPGARQRRQARASAGQAASGGRSGPAPVPEEIRNDRTWWSSMDNPQFNGLRVANPNPPMNIDRDLLNNYLTYGTFTL